MKRVKKVHVVDPVIIIIHSPVYCLESLCYQQSCSLTLHNTELFKFIEMFVIQYEALHQQPCITEYRYCKACLYYRIQILQGFPVLQNTDIAGLVCIMECRYISYIYTIVYQGSLKTVVTAGVGQHSGVGVHAGLPIRITDPGLLVEPMGEIYYVIYT